MVKLKSFIFSIIKTPLMNVPLQETGHRGHSMLLPSPSNILEIMEGLINKYVSHWSCKSLNVMITWDQGTMGETTEGLPS